MNWRRTLLFGLARTLTPEQEVYLDAIMDNQLVIVNAPSGTGKTTLAIAAARLIGKPLYYLFSPVQEGVMGFRPGSQLEKEAEYLLPLTDALVEIGEDPQRAIAIDDMQKKGGAWVFPRSHIFTRGCNFKDATVIIEEAQNWTLPELRKVLTRIHDSCKVIVIGHTGQCDLPNPQLSGFAPMMAHFADKPYVGICELTKNFRGQLSRDADLL